MMNTKSEAVNSMSLISQYSRSVRFTELLSLSRLAGSLIVSSLVTMSISISDVVMIGQLGTVELAAAAAVSDFYSIFFYLVAGVIAAISPIIAKSRAQKQFSNIKSKYLTGLAIGMLFGVPASIVVYNAASALAFLGVTHDIVDTAVPYANLMALALFPMLVVSSLHYFLSAHDKTNIILYATILGLPMNILGNYLFLYGSWGAPDLGLAGAGVATALSGCSMFVFMLVYIIRHTHLRRYFVIKRDSNSITSHAKEIIKVGVPIGVSHVGEMGVFLAATVSMGYFGAEVLAAHTIALRAAGVFYAIPLGYAQAAMVRIGYLTGKQIKENIVASIESVIILAFVSSLLLSAFIMLTGSSYPYLTLTNNQITSVVLEQTSIFLLFLAIMQPSMVIGTIAAGALRGFKETRAPMMYSLLSYWGFGFFGALAMAFNTSLAGQGIWLGLLLASYSFMLLTLVKLNNFRRQFVN